MKIEKTECSYQVTKCDLKFGEQITLDGELLIPISVLDRIRAEIESQRKEVNNKYSENDELLTYYYGLNDGLKDARDILDKYKAESEG